MSFRARSDGSRGGGGTAASVDMARSMHSFVPMSQRQSKAASLGAVPSQDRRTTFTVWAPRRRTVELELEGRAAALPLEPRGDGYFSGAHRVAPGERYRFRLDGGEAFPDPCSRFQPGGPHGPSEVVDPRAFSWTDQDWKGPSPEGQVI